jgi:uncharacterized membrane protein YdbT with pleckstrin-like domain
MVKNDLNGDQETSKAIPERIQTIDEEKQLKTRILLLCVIRHETQAEGRVFCARYSDSGTLCSPELVQQITTSTIPAFRTIS